MSDLTWPHFPLSLMVFHAGRSSTVLRPNSAEKQVSQA